MIRHCSVWIAGLILATSSAAWAAPTPEDVALSEALFREGKTLLQEGKFDQACPKLAESHRLDPAGGTLVTLGLCYEGAGKTASAWVVFGDALVACQEAGMVAHVSKPYDLRKLVSTMVQHMRRRSV